VALKVGFLDHPALAGGEYDRRSAFHWLIENAAWKDHQTRTRAGMITIKRGQVVAARKHLAETWGWTEKRVRTFMELLRTESMIEMGQREDQYANVVTICNYDTYQSVSSAKGQPKASERPAEGPTKGQREANEGPYSTKDTILPKKEPLNPQTGNSMTAAQIEMKNALVPKDDYQPVAVVDGKLVLYNGTRTLWLEKFGGDEERLELALIEAQGSLQTYGNRSIAVQVNAKLANIVARKRDGDKRYKAAVDSKSMPTAITPKLNIWWNDKAKVAAITPDEWRKRIIDLGDGQWNAATLGPDPSNNSCVVPDLIRREMRLSDKFDQYGLRIKLYAAKNEARDLQ
jgi:hypothetical protein